jgi:photosystem II stability/assembly factor-like uncharacterized protein
MGGRISAMDVVHSDRRIIYVGAASGGVWKTVNGGTTFDPIFDKYTQSIGSIAIDQERPDTVWVGTGEPWVRNSVSVGTGIYKTTDGGDEWKLMGLEKSERVGEIIIDPRSPDTVYAAVLGHLWDANEERGLYKTENGGETWENILFIDENTGCTDIAIDPQEPDIIYASMWQFRREPCFFTSGGPSSGLHKSTDGGKTWKKLTNGLPKGELGRIAIAVAPSRPNVLYAVVESKKTALYRSEDLGQTWVKKSDDPIVKDRPFYFSLIIVDPQDYDRVYKPATMLSISRDGGETFTTGFGGVHPDHHAMWIDPEDPNYVLTGTDGGIYVSFDRAGTFRFLNNLPISQFYQISCDQQRPYNIYGGLQDNGQWFGPSQSPGGIENKDWQSIGFGDGFHTYADPTDNDIVYWELQGGRIYRKDMKTGEQKDIQPQPGENDPDYRFNWNTPIAMSPNNPGMIYFGSQFLFRSSDRGNSWERISGDLTTDDPKKQRQEESGGLTVDNTTAENHCTIYTISESPVDGGVIWVGTDDGNVQVSENGGESWKNVIGNIDDLPKSTWCSSVEPSHYDRATAYVTFDGHRTGEMKPYLFRTTDMGETWKSLSNDSLIGYCHVVREDLENPNLLFVGTEFGLFVSIDGGSQWVHYKEDFPKVSVRDLVIHPEESDLVIGTHGRGIYIIDDITPLRQITTEVLSSNVHLFKTAPYVMRSHGGGQQFAGSGDFVGSNPSEVAKITYYLKKRHLFGDMKFEIFDPEGKLIKTLPGSKRKGINRINWQMRLKPPKVPPAKTLAYQAMAGPLASEGAYTVKMTKGKETYTGQIELAGDPDSPHSAEDRALQQKTVMRLYRIQERLAYVAEGIEDARDQADDRADDLKKKDGLRKDLEKFSDELTDLHETLVITEEIQGIPGIEKLRGKVVGLYGSILGYWGKPSEDQLKRIPILDSEIDKASDEFESMTANLESLNSKLEKKKLERINLLTKEEFDRRD